MTSKQIERAVILNLAERAFPIYLTNYSNRGFSDADIFGITKAGQMYEFEIKVSRSDFLADFKNKTYKHHKLLNREAINTYRKWKNGKQTDETYDLITLPNRFYFACPLGLINKNELPNYAGLIYIERDNKYIEIKSAPILHHYKANEIIYKNIATILCQRNIWGCSYRTYKYKNIISGGW